MGNDPEYKRGDKFRFYYMSAIIGVRNQRCYIVQYILKHYSSLLQGYGHCVYCYSSIYIIEVLGIPLLVGEIFNKYQIHAMWRIPFTNRLFYVCKN